MKIAIDAMGIEKAGGGRTATLNLLRPLFEIDQENEYLVAVSTREPLLDTPAGNVRQWVLPVKNRFLKRIYAHAAFPVKLREFDLVHFTKNLGLWGPMPPKVLTVYDVSMLKLPEIMPRSDYLYWRVLQKLALVDVDCVITISKSAAQDIVHFYRIPEKKIRVIYPGIAPHFCPAGPEQVAQARAKYYLPERYLLHVGRIDPIKNLTTLVQAFDRLLKKGVYDGKLVLVGEFYKKTPDLNLVPTIERLGLQNEVLLAGYIPDVDLPAVFSGAEAKVFPSLNEGFGFVPLEAMACGTPVIASRSGSLPEVLGDAALLLKSPDVDTLATEMERLVTDPALRRDLRERGPRQASRFNWRNTAGETLNVYREFSRR
jgi:glycosyltransferase involved in cell wall biosynthesis